MKVLYSWLSSYLKNPPDFNTTISNLSRIGFGIDEVVKLGVEAQNVCTAKVLEKKKHPNADKLFLCKVTDGNEVFDVVCGAKNVDVGQIVPFAKVGAKLGEMVIKKTKIRGIESNGMICSKSELGLGKELEGIMVLDPDTKIGVDIRDIFPTDYVFELEITPNLSYCLSHYSLARELSIFYGYELNEIKFKPLDCKKFFSDFDIEINTDNCRSYLGIVIENITNTKTPSYIYERLKNIGLNPKGNILIDVSNYVMFELGQPTHCFDLNNIKQKIIVRMACEKEKIKALDLSEYELSNDIMIISDVEKPLAVAGVIGGYYSSISESTRDILIEVANFVPQAVRRSSKLLNIKSDSSYRFERGVDIQLIEKTAARMVEFITSQNPDAKIKFCLKVDNYRCEDKKIKIDYDRINNILGTELKKDDINNVLRKIDTTFNSDIFTVPSYRTDIETIYDIAEEIARYIGYDIIESKTSMQVAIPKNDCYYNIRNDISYKTSVFSMNECYNYDLVSDKDISIIGFDRSSAIKLQNPLSSEFEYLRPSPIISLLKNARYNLNRGIKSIKLYEFGTVFLKVDGKHFEQRFFASILCGKDEENDLWCYKTKDIDFFYTKMVVNHILNNFEIDHISDTVPPFIVKDVSNSIFIDDKKIGFYGLINPDLSNIFDIKNNAFYIEVNIDLLLEFYKDTFVFSIRRPKEVSNFQYGLRDLSFTIEKKYRFVDFFSIIKNTPDLHNAILIDVYEGKNIESDRKSFTFRLIFSSNSKTFTDEELNSKIKSIVEELNLKFGAKLR